MTRHLRLREFLVGVEGLALLRGLFTGTDEAADRRITETRRILAEAEAFACGVAVPQLGVDDGYARWSTTYDVPDNPLISAEQPIVWELIDAIPPGRALDAACGTGRHTRRLVERGHQVVGLDATPEMLARARENVPEAHFQQGDLRDLPFDAGRFDIAVCALALDHVQSLRPAVTELARVVQRGGRVIISDMHPVLKVLGGAAFFRDADGASALVRGHGHSHADYLDAFAAADLQLRYCIEAAFGHGEVAMQKPAATFVPEATEAAYLGLPAVLIWELIA